MRPTRPVMTSIAAAAVVLALVEAPLIATADHAEVPGIWIPLLLLVSWGFVGAGLLAWWRRPENRTGPLMVLVGFAFCVAAFQGIDVPLLFAVGTLFGAVFTAAAIHLLLAFPSGRLGTGWDRLTVWTAYLITTVGMLPFALFTNWESSGCDECPDNVLLISVEPIVEDVSAAAVGVLALFVLIGTGVELVRRWRSTPGAQRRAVRPVLASGVLLMFLLGASILAEVAGAPRSVQEGLLIGGLTAFGFTPYVFLAALARTRLERGGAVSDLLARLAEAPGPGELRDALAQALRDDSLMLAYWLPDARAYVDARGHPAELSGPESDRAVVHVQRDGEPVAAIVHDARVDGDPGLVEAVGSAAALALENERLDAELCAKVEELRASRMRLVEVGLAERRGLERNLHDGAQQRLVSLALTLRMAQGRVDDDPTGARELLDGAARELDHAIGELRELARGIHPAVLSDRGLNAALEALAGRSPVPVEVEALPAERLPEPVELAAYYVISEALANVVKYADASHATVNVARANGSVVVAVADDGVGGADPARGSGLRGLADRLGALEGRLEVTSEPGAGTTVRAGIPCA